MKIHCRTNLDYVMASEHWPEELPERPVVGDLIQSTTSWPENVHLELRVVATTWKCERFSLGSPMIWYLEVELSVPYDTMENIRQFQERYAMIRSGGQASYK